MKILLHHRFTKNLLCPKETTVIPPPRTQALLRIWWFVLVSTVPITILEHQALMDDGVVVLVLGESFERWKASRMSEAAAGVWEV